MILETLPLDKQMKASDGDSQKTCQEDLRLPGFQWSSAAAQLGSVFLSACGRVVAMLGLLRVDLRRGSGRSDLGRGSGLEILGI